jgi:hypothetical protein
MIKERHIFELDYCTQVAGPTQNNCKNRCQNFSEILKIKEYLEIFVEMASSKHYFKKN